MEDFNINFTKEMTHLLNLNSQIGVRIQCVNQYEQNVSSQYIINTLSGTLIPYVGICDSLLHYNSSILVKYSQELIVILDQLLDATFIELLGNFGIPSSPGHDTVVVEAQAALRSIINKTIPSV